MFGPKGGEEEEKLGRQRGEELADLLTTLGPTFIKVGQSLSIRSDLLSPPYVLGLTQLQDAVPPFSSKEAFAIMEEEFRKPVDEIFSKITPEPIASASLGQVYKATLRETGEDVAVKIQRPRSVEKIALDMHLVRQISAPLRVIFNLNTDLVGTVDNWGVGFVDELDYIKESDNAKAFNVAIKTTTLSDVVFAPDPIDKYSTRNILTTTWIDGERLDKSTKDDIATLCSVAMNTYLSMMLEVRMRTVQSKLATTQILSSTINTIFPPISFLFCHTCSARRHSWASFTAIHIQATSSALPTASSAFSTGASCQAWMRTFRSP